MSLILKIVLYPIAAIALLLCALVVYLNFGFKPEAFTTALSKKIHEKTARTLSIQGVNEFKIFPTPRITIAHLAISEPNSSKLFIEAKNVDAALAWLPLLSLKAELSHLTLAELNYYTSAGVVRASAVKTQVQYQADELHLSDLQANFYEGKLSGQARYQIENKKLNLSVQTDNTKIDALLRDALGAASVSGRAKLGTQLSMLASDANTLKKSLNGQAKIEITDAAFTGVNLADWWRQWRSLRGQAASSDGQQKGDFTTLAATLQIKNGVAQNQDLNAQSPFARLTGAGKIDIANDAIDYLAQANFVNNPQGQSAADDIAQKNLNIPVQITGSMAHPNFVPNWGAVLNSVAGAAAQKKLEELANEKLGGKGAEVVKDLLKGLFGK